MPVLDDTATLLDVVFWEDVFKEKQVIGQKNLELPVVIMAGGKGTRLKPITNIIPKPLIPIGEKPIAEVIIDRFVKMGSKDFYMSINYKAKMIESYFNEITDKEYSVNYFYETKPLGTAGSLHLLKDKIKSTFFVSNCDIIVDQDYKEMYDYHCTNNNELTLIAVVKHLEIPYGTIKVKENGLLESIHEKPKYTFLVNAGVYILEPQLLAEIPKDEFFHITDLIEKIKERKGRIGVFPVNEAAWMDIGQWKNYQETLKRFDSAINL
jgi:NDP-sugar pyrophosphorylase family protein